MADKVIGIKIVLDGEQQISDLDKELIKVNKELKAMQAQQKALNKDFESVNKSTKAYDDLLKKEIDLKRQIKEASEAQKELNKTFEYTKVAVGSYNELQGELRQLTNEFKAMSEAERNADVGKNTVDRINELKTQLKELDKGIGDNFRNVGNYTDSINESMANFKTGFTDAFAGFTAAGAGAFAASAVMDFVKGSVAAFNEAENAAAQLENVIVNIGGESSAAFERLLNQADELESKTFGFTAEQIQDAQAALSVFGLTAQEIEKLTPLILDYATVTGKDLNAATGDVTNALLGKTKALKEVGIFLDEDNVSVETLTGSLDRFGGSAERALSIGTNRMERLTDSIGKLQEAVGGYLAEVGLWYVDLIEKTSDITQRLSSGASESTSNAMQATWDFFSGASFRRSTSSAMDWLNRVTMSAEERLAEARRKEEKARAEWDDRAAMDIPKITKITGGSGGAVRPEKMKEQAEAVQAVADSYEGLNTQLSALREKYNLLSEAERKGEVGQTIINNTIAIKQQIDAINNEIKEAEKTAEEEKRKVLIQEKYKTFGEVKRIEEVEESERLERINTNTQLQIDAINSNAKKILEAQMAVNEENAKIEREQLEQIENTKNEIQAQAFDFALILSKAYQDSRLNQIKEGYDKENELLQTALANNQITQAQYDKEKLANDKKQAAEEIKVRKQLAAVQKTITLAEIAINLAKELSQINANFAVNTDISQTLRTVLTVAAIGRAGLQAATVLSQKFARGGIIDGPSHAEGGVKARVGNNDIELQGGEAVINTVSTRMFRDELSAINVAGGGRSFAAGGLIPYAYQPNQAGTVDMSQIVQLIGAVNSRIDRLQVVQSVQQLTDVQNNQKKVYQDSRI